jgi:hypothetical protein
MIWHNNVDLIMEHHKIKQAYNSSQTNKKGKGRMRERTMMMLTMKKMSLMMKKILMAKKRILIRERLW